MSESDPQSSSVIWQGIPLPGFAASLASVGKARRDALVVHLERLLPSAYAAYGTSRTREPAQITGNSDACRVCNGYCCRNGGDMAFLTDEALRIVWSQQPQTSKADLISDYLEAVPEMAFAASCIFHSEHGCSVPDQLRSNICQTYLCEPLKAATAQSP